MSAITFAIQQLKRIFNFFVLKPFNFVVGLFHDLFLSIKGLFVKPTEIANTSAEQQPTQEQPPVDEQQPTQEQTPVDEQQPAQEQPPVDEQQPAQENETVQEQPIQSQEQNDPNLDDFIPPPPPPTSPLSVKPLPSTNTANQFGPISAQDLQQAPLKKRKAAADQDENPRVQRQDTLGKALAARRLASKGGKKSVVLSKKGRVIPTVTDATFTPPTPVLATSIPPKVTEGRSALLESIQQHDKNKLKATKTDDRSKPQTSIESKSNDLTNLFSSSPTIEKAAAQQNSAGRSALFQSIQEHRKTTLNHVETNDRSAPVIKK